MRVIEAAVEHRKSHGHKYLDIPEWRVGDEPVRIYWTILSIAERKKLESLPDASDVDVLIYHAKDAEGKPLFGVEDKPALRNKVDQNIITRIAAAILGTGLKGVTVGAVAESEKN